MNRQYANPAGQWGHHLPGVKVHHGVKCGNMIFVAGQVAFDERGNLLFPYDLEKQTRITITSAPEPRRTGSLRFAYGSNSSVRRCHPRPEFRSPPSPILE